MRGITFTHHQIDTLTYCATAKPRDGGMLRVESFAYSRTADLLFSHGPLAVTMRLTVAEARAMAGELLACADAIDADPRGKTGKKGSAQ